MKKRNYNTMKKENNNIIDNSLNNNEQEDTGIMKILSLPKLTYSHNLNKDLLINNINYKNNNINETNFYRKIDQFLINIYVTKINNFKINIPNNFFIINEINPDGNCFFRSVSKFFTGNEENYSFFRNIVYNYIGKHKNEYIINNNYIEYKGGVIDIEDYIEMVKLDGNFSGELEISAITKIFNISIYLFELNENSKFYKLVYKNISESEFIPYCLLLLHLYLNNNKKS